MDQQFDPAVGQVRNGCVFVSVHTVDARHFHSTETGRGERLALGGEIRAIDRAAHPPPARPRPGFGGCIGPPEVGRLSHGDLGEKQQRKQRPPEAPPHARGLVSSIQNVALANHSTVPTSISAACVSQVILPTNTRKDGTTVSARPAKDISSSAVRMVYTSARAGCWMALRPI